MIPPLQAIKRILWNNLTNNKKEIVPVIWRSYPLDKSPCITLDDSGGSRFLQRYIRNEFYPLDSNHPQFDVNEPFKKHPQQVFREYYSTVININVWCNSPDEREDLNNQIQRLFYEAQTDHYRFCNNYDSGDDSCSYCQGPCYARLKNNSSDNLVRSVKQQCPNPLLYHYSNIFKTYNLTRSTFHLDQPYTLDDTSKHDVMYRSVFKLHTSYYTDYIIGGLFNNKMKLGDNQVL